MRVLYASPADLQANESVWKAVKNQPTENLIQALSAASSLADSYVSSRYQTPFLSYGDDFKRAVLAIAIYDLLSERGMNLDGSDQNFRLRYEDALKWLTNINKGVTTPEGLYGGSTGGGGGGGTGGGVPGSNTYGQNPGSPRISTARPRRW